MVFRTFIIIIREKDRVKEGDAPTTARGEGLQPYGALYCFGKVSKGERREDARQVALGQPGLPLAD